MAANIIKVVHNLVPKQAQSPFSSLRGCGKAAYGLLLLVSVCIAALAIAGVIYGWRIVPILSGSMRPHLQPGNAVIMHPAKAQNIQPGDIIGYASALPDAPLVVHRVVKVEQSDSAVLVVTKGDANEGADPWTTRLTNDNTLSGNIVVPYGGWVLDWLDHLGVWRIIAMTFTLSSAMWTVRKLWSKPRSTGLIPMAFHS